MPRSFLTACAAVVGCVDASLVYCDWICSMAMSSVCVRGCEETDTRASSAHRPEDATLPVRMVTQRRLRPGGLQAVQRRFSPDLLHVLRLVVAFSQRPIGW